MTTQFLRDICYGCGGATWINMGLQLQWRAIFAGLEGAVEFKYQGNHTIINAPKRNGHGILIEERKIVR
jgi:hypothetical protein